MHTRGAECSVRQDCAVFIRTAGIPRILFVGGCQKEAILVKIKGLGAIGHVANSTKTVIGESCSAGRLYDHFRKKAEGRVMYVTSRGALCKFKD